MDIQGESAKIAQLFRQKLIRLYRFRMIMATIIMIVSLIISIQLGGHHTFMGHFFIYLAAFLGMSLFFFNDQLVAIKKIFQQDLASSVDRFGALLEKRKQGWDHRTNYRFILAGVFLLVSIFDMIYFKESSFAKFLPATFVLLILIIISRNFLEFQDQIVHADWEHTLRDRPIDSKE